MMIFLKRKFVCYFKNNFNINTIIFKRISLQISIAIDKYKNDNKILMINFDVFSEYIISRSDPIKDCEELKILIKMLLDYGKITNEQKNKFSQLFKKLISLYPNIEMKDYWEIFNHGNEFNEVVKDLNSVLYEDLSKFLNLKKNQNSQFIKNNYQYIYNMKSHHNLKYILEKNYAKTINQLNDVNLFTNKNYLLFLIMCGNFLNYKLKIKILDNLKVNEIIANKNDLRKYLEFIFENNFENLNKRLVEIINIINNNKDSRISLINSIYREIYKYNDINLKMVKYPIHFYERTISILEEIDRKKNQNELLDLYCYITKNYNNLRYLMFMTDIKNKSIFENFHNLLFELYDRMSELTPKISSSYNENDIFRLLKICWTSSNKNIMDDKLTWFFENNLDVLMNISLRKNEVVASYYFIISFIGFSKRNKKYILLLNNVKLFLNLSSLDLSLILDHKKKIKAFY